MTAPNYLTRRAASVYLLERQGVKVSPNTLQKLACIGGGPLYRIFGNKALYTPEDLDAWVSEKIGAPRHFASEACGKAA